MQMNAMPIDSMSRNEKRNINLMLFNEIDNFIEAYTCNNSVMELIVFWDLFLWSDWSPRKLGDQIPSKELVPKTRSFNKL